jgi:hypothetical protein
MPHHSRSKNTKRRNGRAEFSPLSNALSITAIFCSLAVRMFSTSAVMALAPMSSSAAIVPVLSSSTTTVASSARPRLRRLRVRACPWFQSMLLLQGCFSHCSSIWAPARPPVPCQEVVQWRRLPAPRRRWPPERAPVSFISLHFLVFLGVLVVQGFTLLWCACSISWGFTPCCSGLRASL